MSYPSRTGRASVIRRASRTSPLPPTAAGTAGRRLGHRGLVVALAVALGLAGCTTATTEPDDDEDDDNPVVTFDGPDGREVVNAEALEDLAFTVEITGQHEAPDVDPDVDPDGDPDGDPDAAGAAAELGPFAGAVWTLGEVEVTDDVEVEVRSEQATARYVADDLDDGDHQLTVDLPAVHDGERHTWTFTVAATPPELTITEPEDGVLVAARGLTIAGETTGVEVTLDGQAAEVDDGVFTLELDEAPQGEVELVATDEHGNTTTASTTLVVVPSRADVDEIRGVHVTPHAWATPSFRERILGMVDDGLITTVQLDLKDESGEVGYRTEVELAREIGAAADVYDLADAVETLHDLDVRVVGRIVAFRDRNLADWAWENGERDMVIQTPDGQPYAGYGGFTSFAHEEVIEYNLAIAEEAAAAGVDDILWDYIRRPDGPVENLVVAGISEDADGATMEQAIVDFTARADERLAPYGVQHGASVYGIAATRPTEIAQDIPGMAEHLDYVAPMVYPSHWGPGEYNVADPNRQPFDITSRSLEGFLEAVEGTRARVVPWLEDTRYRAWNRTEQVREQIRGAAEVGIDEWLMWDPFVQYTLDAYDAR